MALGFLSPRNVVGYYFERLELAMSQYWANQISTDVFPSDQEFETYAFTGMVPRLTDRVGGHLVPKELTEHRIVVYNGEYGAQLAVKDKDWRRDKTRQIETRVGDLATATVEHWGEKMSAALETANATAGYDSSYFFATDHSEGSSGTQSNYITNSTVEALNTTNANSPTIGEFAQAVNDLLPILLGFKDNQGKPLNQGMSKVLVMVPVNMAGTASAALTAAKIEAPSGTGSIDNPLNYFRTQAAGKFALEAMPNPYLTDKSMIYLFRTDGGTRPFIRQEEVAPQMSVLGPGSDHWVKNREYLFDVYTSRAIALGWWYTAVQAKFS